MTYEDRNIAEATEAGDTVKVAYYEYRKSVKTRTAGAVIAKYGESTMRAAANRFRDDSLANRIDRDFRRYVGD